MAHSLTYDGHKQRNDTVLTGSLYQLMKETEGGKNLVEDQSKTKDGGSDQGD